MPNTRPLIFNNDFEFPHACEACVPSSDRDGTIPIPLPAQRSLSQPLKQLLETSMAGRMVLLPSGFLQPFSESCVSACPTHA